MSYVAFISYKHDQVSRPHAEALEAALKQYSKPLWKPPIAIFRDERFLRPGDDLPRGIRKALEASRFVLYLATANAAQSDWVAEELRVWCKDLGRADRLIIAHVADSIAVDPQSGTIDWERTDALPRLLEPYLASIPIWADLSWAKTSEQRNLDNVEYHKLINGITARLRSITPGEMNDQQVLTHRRNMQVRNAILVVVLVFSGVATYFWDQARRDRNVAQEATRLAEVRLKSEGIQRQRADDERGRAEVQRTIAEQERTLAKEQQAIAEDLLASERTESARQQLLAGRWDAASALLVSVFDDARASELQRVMLASAMGSLRAIRMQWQSDGTPAVSVAFSGSGKAVAIGHSSNAIYIYDTSSGRLTTQLSLNDQRVLQVVLDATGKRLLTVGLESEINGAPEAGYTLSYRVVTSLWDLRKTKVVRSWGHRIAEDEVPTAAEPWASRSATGEGFRIRGESGSADEGAMWYSFSDGKPTIGETGQLPARPALTQLTDGLFAALQVIHYGESPLAARSDDGDLIVSVGRSGATALVDARLLSAPWRVEVPVSAIAASATADGKRFVVLGHDGRLLSIDAETGRVIADLVAGPDDVGYELSADGTRATVLRKGAILLVDAFTGAKLRTLSKRTAGMRFSSNSRFLASWTEGGSEARITLYVYAASDGKRAYVSELIGEDFSSFAINASSSLWVAKAESHQQSGNAAVADDVKPPHVAKAMLTEFLGASDTSVTGLEDGSVAFGSSPAGVPAHRKSVSTLAQVGNGANLASGSADGELVLWDVARKGPKLVLRGHEGPVTALQFTADARWVASGGHDGTARLWDAHSGREVLRWRPTGDPIRAVSISADGRYLLTATSKRAHVWAIDRELRRASELVVLAREKLLTCDVDRGGLRRHPPKLGQTRGECGRVGG